MADSAAIKSGEGYVSMGMDLGPLQAGLNSAKRKLQAFGAGIMAAGKGMLATGLAMGGALLPGVMAFATYEQSLADLMAAANATPEEMDRVRESIEGISKATGVDPNEVADGFRQLLFAGVKLNDVLAGAGETLIKFARVGLMPAGEAALVLTDAVNVFARDTGMSFARAADIITQGASASSISIKDVADSFSQSGSAMAQLGQNMYDTATAIGIMGNAGVKGAQAGTSLKTIMTRLATGAGEAGEAVDEVSRSMQQIGLTVYDAAGHMLPLVEIINRINTGLEGKTDIEKNQIIKGLAGMRGMIGLLPLLRAGADGFQGFGSAMAESLTVEQRFAIMSDTLLTQLKRLWVHIQFVAIEIGAALAPALRIATDAALPMLNWAQMFIRANQNLIQAFAFDAIKAVAFGAALIGVGAAIYTVGAAFGVLAGIAGAVATAVGVIGTILAFVFSVAFVKIAIVAAALAILGYGLYQLYEQVPAIGEYFASWGVAIERFQAIFHDVWGGMVTAMSTSNFGLAWEIAVIGMRLVWHDTVTYLQLAWLDLKNFIMTTIDEWLDKYIGTSLSITQIMDAIVDGQTLAWRTIGSAMEGALDRLGRLNWGLLEFLRTTRELNEENSQSAQSGGGDWREGYTQAEMEAMDRAIERGTAEANAFYERQAIQEDLDYARAIADSQAEEQMGQRMLSGSTAPNAAEFMAGRSAGDLNLSSIGTFSSSAVNGMFGSRNPINRVADAAEEQVAIQLRQERLLQQIREARPQWR